MFPSDYIDELDYKVGLVGQEPIRPEDDEDYVRLSVLNDSFNDKNERKDIETIAKLVHQFPKLLERYNDSGMLPLHVACKKGASATIVKFLLEQGHTRISIMENSEHEDNDSISVSKIYDDINIKDERRKMTPLHWACRKGRKHLVQLLLSYQECDVQPHDDIDYSVPMHWSCYIGDTDSLELLIQNNADIRIKDKYGFEPIHWACRSGAIDIVKLLLEYGADLHALTDTNSSPLHCACFEGHQELSLYLIEIGASTELKNKRGFSALDLWNRRGRMDSDLSMAEGYLELK